MISDVAIDYLKTKTKNVAPNSYQFYNLNVPEHLSTEESNVLENLYNTWVTSQRCSFNMCGKYT